MTEKPRNRAECLNCGDIIESKFRHDFVTCSCFDTSTNLRHKIAESVIEQLRNFPGDFTDSQYENIRHQVACALASSTGTGFFLDGGQEYTRCGGNLSHIKFLT